MLLFKVTLLSIAILLTYSKPNKAKYIEQQGRSLIIGHRGLAGLLPENTLQSFSAALYQGADFIQMDVLYSKDKKIYVMHDAFLSRITDIRNYPQFYKSREERKFEGQQKMDWWGDLLRMEQLKKLKVKQDQAPGRLSIFDFKFGFPTLEQVIQLCIDFNQQHKGARNPNNRLAGMLIEAKNPEMFRQLYGYNMAQDILDILKKYGLDTIQNATKYCPIYHHSFDFQTVKYWGQNSQLPNNYLLEKATEFNLDEVNLYATGIGFEDSYVWNYDTMKPTETVNNVQKVGMKAHVWTFKDDALLFGAQNSMQMYDIGQNLLKLDGIITEFPDTFAPLSQLYQKNNTTSEYSGEKIQRIHYHLQGYN